MISTLQNKKESNPTLHKYSIIKGCAVFAYIRRSTTNKQDLSIQRQEDSAHETVTGNGYIESEVDYFIESKTAYNGVNIKDGKVVRRRSEFTRMLSAIDKSPIPVILLTYEDSRLSRNDPDSTEILARLFGEYEKSKQKIAKIVFNGGETWTPDSNKGDIKQRLLDRYKESLKTGERSRKASIRELKKGRYIYSTPRGINRLNKGEMELTTNEEIPFIIMAWEMRGNGKSKKDINKFLNSHGINLNCSFEAFFQTLIYAGYWMDPENGDLVKQKFKGGNAPISFELYQKVQETLIINTGVKGVSKYGIKQEGDAIANLLKWEIDKKKAFSVEFPKGKYKSYKSNAYGTFNKSESKILNNYLIQTTPIFKKMMNKIMLLFIIKKGVTDERFRIKVQKILKDSEAMSESEVVKYFINELHKVMSESKYVNEVLKQLKEQNESFVSEFYSMIKLYFEEVAKKNKQLDIEERELQINKVKNEIKKKEDCKKQVMVNALKNGFTLEVANTTIQEIEDEIKELESHIFLLSKTTDIEDFISKLPQIFLKIFELSSNMLPVKENDGLKGDLVKLLELTTFELSVDTKKELTVKLFEGLENVLKDNCSIWLPK